MTDDALHGVSAKRSQVFAWLQQMRLSSHHLRVAENFHSFISRDVE